jgi:hypothetical protein
MDRLTEEFFSHATINPELWSEPLEELVLFDFHFDGKESENAVTDARECATENAVRKARRDASRSSHLRVCNSRRNGATLRAST